jgi:hypothetical protein
MLRQLHKQPQATSPALLSKASLVRSCVLFSNTISVHKADGLPVSEISSSEHPQNSTAQSSTARQPFEQSLRQESYTNDTDRSFPLAGGVAPKHNTTTTTTTTTHSTGPQTSAIHNPSDLTSATHHPITSEREPGTKERKVEARDGHGREGLAGAAATATALGVAAPLAQSHHREELSRGQDPSSAAYGDQSLHSSQLLSNASPHTTQGAHPEAVAAARAAAANSSTISPSTQTHGLGAQDSTFGTTSRALDTSSSAAQPHSTGILGSEPLRDTSFANTSTVPDVGESTTQPRGTGGMDPGRPPGGRSISYRHVPGGFPTATPDESKTFLFYRDNVVADPSAEEPGHTVPKGQYCHPEHDQTARRVASGGSHASHDHGHSDSVGSGSTTTGPHNSDLLNKLDPRVDSDLDGSKTTKGGPSTQHDVGHGGNVPLATGASAGLLASQRNVGHDNTATLAPGSSAGVLPGQHDTSQATDTSLASATSGGVPSDQHGLRHTGTLEQPRPRSSDMSEDHHFGRDAAVVGGLGAGAAGLGYAATHNRNTAPTGSDSLSHGSSPYSSKQLDPRALGSKANLEEQRYDPQASSHTSPHHGLLSSTPAVASSSTRDHHNDTVGSEASSGVHHKSSLLNKLDPRVKTDSSKTSERTSTKNDEPQSHHGRDAALVGGGAATAGGIHHELHRNDTAAVGSSVLPDERSTGATGPLSSSAPSAPLSGSAPVQSSHVSAPLSSSTKSASHPTSAPADATALRTSEFDTYQGPKTTSGSPFYGTVGAPAPIADEKSSHAHQPMSTSSATAPLAQQQDAHHYGRDTALSGAGLATAGGLAYAGHQDNKQDTGPASNTLGPHSSNAANILDPRVQPDPSKQIHHNVGPTAEDPASRTIGHHESNIANIIDPRVQPDPSKQKAHMTSGPHQSDTLNRLDPMVDEKAGQKDHHIGRDAAIVGGTGAAGYGAYEAAQAYGDHRSTQPAAAMADQRYDTSAAGAHAPNPVPAAGHYDYNNDHTSRNAALGTGAVLGAGGLGYARLKHGDNTPQMPASSTQPLASSSYPTSSLTQPLASSSHPLGLSTQPLSSSSQPLASPGSTPLTQSQPTHGTFGQKAVDPASITYPTHGTIAPQNTYGAVPGSTQAPYGSSQDIHAQDHTKRDAALLGTAGVAAAGGAYASSQDHDSERERSRLEKEQQELLKKEQHDREKDQHKHEKEKEKEAHRLQKEREKEAARLEKEREKEAESSGKKHGILGFLHRDKSKKDRSSADNSPRQSGEVRRSIDNKRHSKEYTAGGAALGAGAGLGAVTTAAAYDHDDSSNPASPRNRLHKDPPVGHPAREALEHHEMGAMHGGKREHVGVDGPIGNPNAISGYQ